MSLFPGRPPMKPPRRRPTYADVMATVAVFLVLAGGTAIAATRMLPKNSVGSGQIKKGAVTPAKLSKSSKAMLTGSKQVAGPQGPAGPAGERGEKGPGGEPGKEGKQGEPGTANVIYSGWLFGTPAANPEEFDGTLARTETISAPSLTAELIRTGSISVYATFAAEPFQLPYTSNAGGGKSSTIGYTLESEKITIRRVTAGCAEASCLVPLGISLEFRYVIVPGTVPAV